MKEEGTGQHTTNLHPVGLSIARLLAERAFHLSLKLEAYDPVLHSSKNQQFQRVNHLHSLTEDSLVGDPQDSGRYLNPLVVSELALSQNPKTDKDIIVKDVIADAMLQQILTRPSEYDIITTLNLNGDYVSDAAAAIVGGLGMAPGANIGDNAAIFEATHGTAPKYAGQDKVNPGSLILSAEMMLRHLGWTEAADLIISAMESAIQDKKVTYDFARLIDDAKEVSCSEFGRLLIKKFD